MQSEQSAWCASELGQVITTADASYILQASYTRRRQFGNTAASAKGTICICASVIMLEFRKLTGYLQYRGRDLCSFAVPE